VCCRWHRQPCLLRRYPLEREGELARRHNALVSAGTLAEIAGSIGLGATLRLGDSEPQVDDVRPTILADALEAVLGAVFLDAGFAAAAACIERLWGERLSNTLAAPRDAKTSLQEWAQARRLPLPAYNEVGREGPPHAPVFVVDVSIKGHDPGRGRAGSKREAERLAAAALLERLGAS
jgi:ribonuclease-3